jgi:hypothetical protein
MISTITDGTFVVASHENNKGTCPGNNENQKQWPVGKYVHKSDRNLPICAMAIKPKPMNFNADFTQSGVQKVFQTNKQV